MTIVFQSVVMGCLIILATSSIVFPILFLVQKKKQHRELVEVLKRELK